MNEKLPHPLHWRIALSVLATFLALAEAQSPRPGQAGKTREVTTQPVAELRTLLADYPYVAINYLWGFEDEHRRRGPVAAQVLKRLRQLTDAELAELATEPSGQVWGSGPGCDLYMTEIIRRGGKQWESFLLKRFRETALTRRKLQAEIDAIEGRRNEDAVERLLQLRKLLRQTASAPGQVESLTALRRLQRRNDPLMILVAGKAKRECRLGYLPSFDVRLTNVDVERKAVSIVSGGDYRSGRRARWRFEVRDAGGRLLAPRILMPRGGMMTWETLEFGESWVATMDLANYAVIDKPGTYTVQILYHDSINIDGMKTVDGLICCRSVPIKLTVKPIEVEVTKMERKQMAEWIAKLPDKGRVKLHGGSYGEQSHQFIPPDTPAGRLLAAWWKAVPQLIRAANSKDINPRRRAWALGLLASIAGQHDPREESGVLPAYEYRHSGWVSLGGFAGDRMGGGLGWSSMSVPTGKIDPKKQLLFAKRWLPWIEKRYIRVKIVKAGGADAE